MTSPTETLIADLLANAPLAAVIGNRIRADLAREADTYPFIVVHRTSFEKVTGLDGSVHARRDTFQLEVWSDKRGEAVDVAELLDAALRTDGLDPDAGDPDAVDPEIGARAVVLNVDVWT